MYVRPNPCEAPEGFCEQCAAPCTAIAEDFGIGPYEYGSISETHHDWEWVSPCCGAQVVRIKPDIQADATSGVQGDNQEPKHV